MVNHYFGIHNIVWTKIVQDKVRWYGLSVLYRDQLVARETIKKEREMVCLIQKPCPYLFHENTFYAYFITVNNHFQSTFETYAGGTLRSVQLIHFSIYRPYDTVTSPYHVIDAVAPLSVCCNKKKSEQKPTHIAVHQKAKTKCCYSKNDIETTG